MEVAFFVKTIIAILLMGFFSFCKTLPKFVPVSDHQIGKVVSDDIERTFHYYIPKQKSLNPLPLIFVLHGGGGSSEGMIYLTRISEIAERDNFIVVFPNGIENRWNDGRGIMRYVTDKQNTNDVKFFREMVSFFKSTQQIDNRRIHVVGLSNGGFMAQRVLCEASDIFASGFTVAATTSKFLSKECVLHEPVSLGFIFGKRDDVIPFMGGTVLIPSSMEPNAPKVPAGESLSFLESLDVWKNRLKCELEEKQYIDSLKKKYPKEILKYSFRNCITNSLLDAYLIESGGHFWPHGFFYQNDKKYGFLTNDLDATNLIVDFFKRTPKSIIGVN
jgi:polyhydroxybutyrate depolymerase